jgi:hypothetical protein
MDKEICSQTLLSHLYTITLRKRNWQFIWKDTYVWQQNGLDSVPENYAILSVAYTAKLTIPPTDNKTKVNYSMPLF